MYTAILEDGTRVNGDKCQWHNLPGDVRIKSLAARIAALVEGKKISVADDEYAGFDAYGFQMYDLRTQDGVVGRGVQLLCVSYKADAFLCVDINLVNGERRCEWRPLSAMTYRQDLLREGVRP